MSFKDASSIYSHDVKRAGIIFSILFILIRIGTEILQPKGQISNEFINGLIAFSLFLIAYSKEKVDDERVRAIRYFTMKITYNLLIALLVSLSFTGEKYNLSFIAIISVLEYLAVFYYMNYFNPDYVFKENIKSNFGIKMVYVILSFLVFATTYNLIF